MLTGVVLLQSDLLEAYRKRCVHRKQRHGNWRQIVIDCGMMCIFPVDGLPCGVVDDLQFHERFGEARDGRMQQRVLLCPNHHDEAHDRQYNMQPTDNHHTSVVTNDICFEQHWYGVQGWAEKFDIDLSRFGSLWDISEAQGLLKLG